MSSIETNIFDAFYNRFVLLDFFGKITPGAVVLATLIIILIEPPPKPMDYLNISPWILILFFTISWIIGIAVSGIGDYTNLIILYPKTISRDIWYQYLSEFTNNASSWDYNQFMRFAILKEACGNAYIAFSISLILIIIKSFTKLYYGDPSWLLNGFTLVLTELFFIVSLRHMHFEYAQRQFEYMIKSKSSIHIIKK